MHLPERNPSLVCARWNRRSPVAIIVCNAAGCSHMTEHDPDFDRQMTIARALMDKHKVALSVLVQGENSPYWTEEFRAKLADVEKRLEKSRTIKPT